MSTLYWLFGGSGLIIVIAICSVVYKYFALKNRIKLYKETSKTLNEYAKDISNTSDADYIRNVVYKNVGTYLGSNSNQTRIPQLSSRKSKDKKINKRRSKYFNN